MIRSLKGIEKVVISRMELGEHDISKKYKNTLTLQRRSDTLNSAFKEGRLTLGPVANRRFERTFQSIKMKSNMLGLLEGLLGNGYQKKGLSNGEMRMIGDLIIADAPSFKFPLSNQRAMMHIHWFHNLIHSSKDPEHIKRDILRTLYMESKPEPEITKVENLVLAGGGAKALSLTGAIKALENHDENVPVKRVAGTSGGAIIAMAYAAGYSAKELESIVKNNNFGLFTLGSNFDITRLNLWAMKNARGSKSNKLHVISDNYIAHFYHDRLMEELSAEIWERSDSRLSKIKERLTGSPQEDAKKLGFYLSKSTNPDAFFNSLLNVIGMESLIAIDGKAQNKTLNEFVELSEMQSLSLYPSPKKAIVNAMRHRGGQDLVRGFFSDLIYDKLKQLPVSSLRAALYGESFRKDHGKVVSEVDVRNINFAQWQSLHREFPEKIKELHISISVKRPMMERFNSKNGYDEYKHEDVAFDNEEFSALSVADAVRVSMNLPMVYKGYQFTVNGKSYLGSDGGLKSNMSLSTFDAKYPPEKTIGVFYKTAKELAAAVDVQRVLALPRSSREVKDEIRRLKKHNNMLAALQKSIPISLMSLESKGTDESKETQAKIQARLKSILDERREVSGRLSAAERELVTLDTQNWQGAPGRLLKGRLEVKSNEDLGRSKNFRRLAMINTHDVSTTDFKLSKAEKAQQIRYGEAAMKSLLNGSYCLENHFFYHHIETITGALVEKEMGLFIDELESMPIDEMDFIPKAPESDSHRAEFKNSPSEIQNLLDDMKKKGEQFVLRKDN